MGSSGEASSRQEAFVHQALIYGSDEEFVDVALPFVREGIERGEPTLGAVGEDNVRNLREALGADASRATLLSAKHWYETSARTRDKFARWADSYGSETRARLMGEPPWAIGHPAQIRDWARHESVINVAFRGRPVTFLCPYDARVLPDEILDHARHTHPEIHDAGGLSGSEAYQDAAEFCRGLDRMIRSPSTPPGTELPFDLEGLSKVRRLVQWEAVYAGLPTPRVEEVVLAVNEIASNALIHGRPPATLRTWIVGGELVFAVADSGEGPEDVLAGQLRPSVLDLGGRGIWLARQACDAVEIANEAGCTVVVRVAAPSRVGQEIAV